MGERIKVLVLFSDFINKEFHDAHTIHRPSGTPLMSSGSAAGDTIAKAVAAVPIHAKAYTYR